MEVHVMKCKREVERKDKELKVSKVIKILGGEGEKDTKINNSKSNRKPRRIIEPKKDSYIK